MGRAYRRRSRKKTSAGSLANDNTHIELVRWCASNSFHIRNLRPYHFHDSGRGMQTTKAIYPGSILIEIPKSLLITTSTALQDPIIHSALNRSQLKPTTVEILSVYLLLEKGKGDKSFWYEYIRSLPETFTTLLYMNPDDVIYLDKDLRSRLDKMQLSIKRMFLESTKIFSSAARLFSYEDFLWAWHVVNTRSFYIDRPVIEEIRIDEKNDDKYALAPFLDMFNHSDSANCTFGYDEEAECYQVITRNNIKPYEQVFIRYGAHDNRALLLEYGFCIKGNCFCGVNFDLEDVISSVICGSKLDEQAFTQKLKSLNIASGFTVDKEGMSWSLEEALRESAKLQTNVLDQELLSDGCIKQKQKFLGTLISERIHFLEFCKLDSTRIKRTETESFILEMLKLLYEDEIEVLQQAAFV